MTRTTASIMAVSFDSAWPLRGWFFFFWFLSNFFVDSKQIGEWAELVNVHRTGRNGCENAPYAFIRTEPTKFHFVPFGSLCVPNAIIYSVFSLPTLGSSAGALFMVDFRTMVFKGIGIILVTVPIKRKGSFNCRLEGASRMSWSFEFTIRRLWTRWSG